MPPTLTLRSCVIALAGLLWLLPVAACSGKQESGQPAQQQTLESEEPADAAQGEQATDAAPESEAVAETPEPVTPADTPPPAPAEEPEAPPASNPESPPSETPADAPPQAPPNDEEPEREPEPKPEPPGGIVAVPATRPDIARVGAEKCKPCHKTEYVSWAATAHATRTPPLDCESCHGPGSKYKTISIMKDPEKARAAGLVIPEKSFCADNCHADTWQDDMLERAHARKVEPVEG